MPTMLIALLSAAWLSLPPLSIEKVGDEARVTVIARTAWSLEASADLKAWVEIASGEAPPAPYLGTVTIIRDNALQPGIFYRLRLPAPTPL